MPAEAGRGFAKHLLQAGLEVDAAEVLESQDPQGLAHCLVRQRPVA